MPSASSQQTVKQNEAIQEVVSPEVSRGTRGSHTVLPKKTVQNKENGFVALSTYQTDWWILLAIRLSIHQFYKKF